MVFIALALSPQIAKSTALAVILLSLAAALGAQAQQWKTYSYPADGFSAAFPVEPQFSKREIPTDKGSFELRSYIAQDGLVSVMIGVCDYGAATQGKDPEDILQGAKNGALQSSNSHLLSESKITLGAYTWWAARFTKRWSSFRSVNRTMAPRVS
jgi:hypothetical protein